MVFTTSSVIERGCSPNLIGQEMSSANFVDHDTYMVSGLVDHRMGVFSKPCRSRNKCILQALSVKESRVHDSLVRICRLC
jgi:hypothetical protein